MSSHLSTLLSLKAEALALVLLVVAAALVRLPYLWTMPQFTDETAESMRSLTFYRGQRFPLTNVADYIGALYNYIQAAGYIVLGPTIYTPRLLALLLGALTVAAAYFLARQMVGPAPALLAAALLVTSAVHVGGNSHIAWSQEITPLFLALTLGLLYRAVHRNSGWSLVGAAFACGLTLQTHPTALAFLPGAVLYFLWKGHAMLRSRWPYLAACLFLVGYSNMIIYNLSTGFQSMKTARSRDAGYGDYRARDLGTYMTNEGRIVLTLLRLPGGLVDARSEASDYLRDPQLLAYAGLTSAGLVILARAGNPLPALVVLSAVLIFPMFGARHDILPRQGRYLAPLLPLLFVALSTAGWRIGQTFHGWLMERGVSRRVSHGLILAAAAALLALPLAPLQRFYVQSLQAGETNHRFFHVLAQIDATRRNDELVILDQQLAHERLGGGGTALLTLDYMLTFRGIPHRDLSFELERVSRRYSSGGVILVLAEKTYQNIGAELPLVPPQGQPSVAPPAPYGVYLLGATSAFTESSERSEPPASGG